MTLLAARPEERPTYLHPTLEGLFEAQPAPQVTDGGAELGGWRGSVIDGTLTLEGEGSVPDWWRVAATVGWSHLDATGAPVSAADLRPPSADPGSPRDSLTA